MNESYYVFFTRIPNSMGLVHESRRESININAKVML